jgi:hypothetical protein
MYDLAVQALASGGRGGRRILIGVLLVIVVAVIAGWVLYARRARASRKKP